MKTYYNSDRVNSRSQRIAYIVIIVCSLIILISTIVLGVLLSKEIDSPVDAPVIDTPTDKPTVTPPEKDEPVVTPPTSDELDTPVVTEPTYCLPIKDGEVLRTASLDALVYMPSINMWKTHDGVDFSATENTQILSIAKGKVIRVSQTTLEGVVVSVEHEGGLVSVYKSLASSSVEEGDQVLLGESIGVAGTMMTEEDAGIHLHLELQVNGELIDPLSILDAEINK